MYVICSYAFLSVKYKLPNTVFAVGCYKLGDIFF